MNQYFPMLWLVTLSAATGCGGEGKADSTCDKLCDELVLTCTVPAFPTIESCVQGCLYSAEQGGDVDGQLECVTTAACDTFAIVECEHEYGVE